MIAKKIRTDSALSATTVEAALDEITRRANPFALKTSRIEREIRDRVFLQSSVIVELGLDQALDKDVRAEALRLAKIRGDSTQELRSRVWSVVRYPNKDAATCSRAVAAARRLYALDPGDRKAASALGAALYRAGEWKNAIDILEPISNLRASTRQGESVGREPRLNLAFLAMAQFRADELNEARATLEALLALGSLSVNGPDVLRPVDEATALILETTTPSPSENK